MAVHRALLMCFGLVSAVRLDGQSNDLAAELPELTPGVHWYFRESEPFQEKMVENLACYCKQVADISECPYLKEDKHSQRPDFYRWFHGNLAEGKKPHYCCKLEKNAWYNRAGWGYQRQATAKLCMMEVRPVPEDVCCRQPGYHGNETIGLHLKQVTLQGYQQIPHWTWHDPNYGKSYPIYTLSDIRGATDFDGTPISAEQVREFLLNKVKSGFLMDFEKNDRVNLQCSKTLMELSKDTGYCHLRSSNAECCCLQASVDPAVRCLPVTGGSSSAEPVVITGSYTESQSRHQHVMDGMIGWPNISSPEISEAGIPWHVPSRDPMTDDQATYNWTVARQWNSECLMNQSVAYVIGVEKSKRYRSGTRRIGKMSKGIYKTKRWTEYVQGHRIECISYKYTRMCPVGQGLYVKKFDEGTCAVPGVGKELQLQKVGSLTMQCPEGYVSGTAGGMKFNPNCSCTEC